jgi:hypothetical protein
MAQARTFANVQPNTLNPFANVRVSQPETLPVTGALRNVKVVTTHKGRFSARPSLPGIASVVLVASLDDAPGMPGALLGDPWAFSCRWTVDTSRANYVAAAKLTPGCPRVPRCPSQVSQLSQVSQTDWQRLQNVAPCCCRSGTRGCWDLSMLSQARFWPSVLAMRPKGANYLWRKMLLGCGEDQSNKERSLKLRRSLTTLVKQRVFDHGTVGPVISNCLQWPHGPAHRSKAGRCCSLPRAGNRPPRYRSFRVTITACPGSWPLSYLALAAASTSPRYWSNRSAGSSRCV